MSGRGSSKNIHKNSELKEKDDFTQTIKDLKKQLFDEQEKNKLLETQKTKYNASEKISKIFTNSLSNEFAIELDIQEHNDTPSKLIVIGRPPIDGSSAQMRHIVPYSFLEQIVHKYTSEIKFTTVEKSKECLDRLEIALKLLAPFKGLGFTEEQYKQLLQTAKNSAELKLPTQWQEIQTKSMESSNKYYLLQNDKSVVSYLKTNNQNLLQDAQLLYINKMQKSITYLITELKDSIISYDSLMIINQVLIKYTLTLFNARPDTSLPNKGNTLPYQIYFYNSPQDAAQANNNFYTITAEELQKKCSEDLTKCKDAVRIVNAEGFIINTTNKALKHINKIIDFAIAQTFSQAQSEIINYNSLFAYKGWKQYEAQYKINTKIDKSNYENIISNICNNNIPNHLYYVFDLKPLEKKVFIPYLSTKDNNIETTTNQSAQQTIEKLKVYGYATGKTMTEYHFINGEEYIAKSSSAGEGEKEPKIVRKDIDVKFLVEKVIDHAKVALLAFFDFAKNNTEQDYNKVVLSSFSNIVKNKLVDYGFTEEDYEKQLEELLKNDGMFSNAQLDVSGASSAVENVDYFSL